MKVNSSHITDITHDPIKNEMHVTFHNGKSYTYAGVSSKEYNNLVNAKSIGSHFHDNFKFKKNYARKK